MSFTFVKNRLRGIGFESITRIKERLRQEKKVASGMLINRTRFEIIDTTSLITMQFKAPAHYKFVDEGRRPGAKFPPRVKIEQWIKRKGIKSDISIKQLAFLISRKISRDGISATNIYTEEVQRIRNKISGLSTDLRNDLTPKIREALQTKN